MNNKIKIWDNIHKCMGYLDHPFDNNCYFNPCTYGNDEIAITNSWKDKKQDEGIRKDYVVLIGSGIYDEFDDEYYEEDIIEVTLYTISYKGVIKLGLFGECEEYNGWYVQTEDCQCNLNRSFNTHCKIIGNTFQNPELLTR